MYCARCNTRLRGDARYCQRCGAPVGAGYVAAPVPAAPYDARYARPSSGTAVAALVCGILALAFFCVPILNVVLGIVAASLGTSGIRKANAGLARGKGMAITGLVCGILGAAAGVVYVVIYLVVRL